jgi:hypothetical protein
MARLALLVRPNGSALLVTAHELEVDLEARLIRRVPAEAAG